MLLLIRLGLSFPTHNDSPLLLLPLGEFTGTVYGTSMFCHSLSSGLHVICLAKVALIKTHFSFYQLQRHCTISNFPDKDQYSITFTL